VVNEYTLASDLDRQLRDLPFACARYFWAWFLCTPA